MKQQEHGEIEKNSLFPEAMLDVGTPSEMSPIEDIAGLRTEPPLVEITKLESWETEHLMADNEMRKPVQF